jgi:hypothetical protein
VLEARLEQADLLKKVSPHAIDPSFADFLIVIRLSILSRTWSKTATSTVMTPVSPSRLWTTPTLP